jgi:hypothetical protein
MNFRFLLIYGHCLYVQQNSIIYLWDSLYHPKKHHARNFKMNIPTQEEKILDIKGGKKNLKLVVPGGGVE